MSREQITVFTPYKVHILPVERILPVYLASVDARTLNTTGTVNNTILQRIILFSPLGVIQISSVWTCTVSGQCRATPPLVAHAQG